MRTLGKKYHLASKRASKAYSVQSNWSYEDLKYDLVKSTKDPHGNRLGDSYTVITIDDTQLTKDEARVDSIAGFMSLNRLMLRTVYFFYITDPSVYVRAMTNLIDRSITAIEKHSSTNAHSFLDTAGKRNGKKRRQSQQPQPDLICCLKEFDDTASKFKADLEETLSNPHEQPQTLKVQTLHMEHNKAHGVDQTEVYDVSKLGDSIHYTDLSIWDYIFPSEGPGLQICQGPAAAFPFELKCGSSSKALAKGLVYYFAHNATGESFPLLSTAESATDLSDEHSNQLQIPFVEAYKDKNSAQVLTIWQGRLLPEQAKNADLEFTKIPSKPRVPQVCYKRTLAILFLDSSMQPHICKRRLTDNEGYQLDSLGKDESLQMTYEQWLVSVHEEYDKFETKWVFCVCLARVVLIP